MGNQAGRIRKRIQVCPVCGKRRLVLPQPRGADVLLCDGYSSRVVLVRAGEFACAWHKTYEYQLSEAKRLFAGGNDPQWEQAIEQLNTNAAAAAILGKPVGASRPEPHKEEGNG